MPLRTVIQLKQKDFFPRLGYILFIFILKISHIGNVLYNLAQSYVE